MIMKDVGRGSPLHAEPVYVFDNCVLGASNQLPAVRGRAAMVHSLIEAYKLLPQMKVVPSTPATEEEVRSFHSEDYVQYLKLLDDNPDVDEETLEEYGLGFDCPVFHSIWTSVCHLAGASLSAARSLMDGRTTVAINWMGGWHHGQRDKAAGFCYVNDIVIAILELRKKFSRVLYIDLDVHHGDGVEYAFEYSTKVLTLSFHNYGAGFYPGTGGHGGKSPQHTINIPLKEGARGDKYVPLFTLVTKKVLEAFGPDCVVCQCGGDALVGDPYGGFNLTPENITACVRYVLSWKKPTLLLGGGGYHNANTARLWTRLTAAVMGISLSEDIPEHEYFEKYGPSHEISISQGNREDLNTAEYIDDVIRHTLKKLNGITE